MFDYVDGAAGTEAAARLNVSALHEVRLQPRVLVNVEQRSVQKRIFGLDAGLPFGIAPMGCLQCVATALLLRPCC